jgi:uncharacterized repeat protein (TIGR01451 family)
MKNTGAIILGVMLAVLMVSNLPGAQRRANAQTTIQDCGGWTGASGMPTGRQNLAAAEIDGQLYAVGGQDAAGILNTLEVYNPATGAWIAKTGMLTPRQFLGAAAIDGLLYAVGGSNANGVVNTLEVYNPATDSWTSKTGMPTARQGLAVAAIDGLLYAMGGNNSNGVVPWLEVYNPAADSWTEQTQMVTAVSSLAAAAIYGKLYAIGGADSQNNPVNTLQVYEPVTQTWMIKTGMPTARLSLAASGVDGLLFAIGGFGNAGFGNQPLQTVEEYNPATDSWMSEPLMPIPTNRDGLATSVIDGSIFAVGGIGAIPDGTKPYLNTLEVYSPAQPNAWASRTGMSSGRSYLAAVEAYGMVYAIGGRVNNQVVNTLEVYNPNTDTWTTKSGMPVAVAEMAAAEIDGLIYVAGGVDGGGNSRNTLQVYDPVTDTWTTEAGMNDSREGPGGAAIDGKLYVAGGVEGDTDSGTTLNTLEVYDPAADTWTRKASMNDRPNDCAAAGVDGNFYLVGGFNGSAQIEIYNPATDYWTTSSSSMPTYVAQLGLAVMDGMLYVAGGTPDFENIYASLQVYNPKTGSWTTGPNMPTARAALGAAVVDGRLYAIGGYVGGGAFCCGIPTLEDLQQAPDIYPIASHTGNFTVGAGRSYLVTVLNATNVDCTTGPITVTDTLPNGLTFASFSSDVEGWTYSVNGQTITATYPLVYSPDELSHLTINVNVTGATAIGTDSITNMVTVSTPDEINISNNTASDPTTVLAPCPVIALTPNSAPGGTAGSPYGPFNFSQTGGGGTATFTEMGTLPNGLMLTGSGALSGTPTQTGSFPIIVTATDSNGCTGSVNITIDIACQPIMMNPGGISAGTAGVPYSTTFTQTGGIGSIAFAESGALPTGLSFNAGVLSGTPVQTGSFPINVTATDSNGCTGSRSYTLTIDCPVITVNPQSLTAGTAGVAYGPVSFTQSGGVGTMTLSEAGALPSGIIFSAGTLSGTPTQTGSFNFSVTATDQNGCGGSRSYTLVIGCPAITVGPASIPAGVAEATYTSIQFSAPGAIGAVGFTESGALPTGLTLSSAGVLSGIPLKTGSFPITVTARDSNGCIGSRSYTVVINCPTITATVSGGGAICPGTQSTVYVTVSGGATPYTVTLTNGGGTQTGAGTTFTFKVSPAATTTYQVATSSHDINNCLITSSGSTNVTVDPPPVVTTNPASQTGIAGSSARFVAGANGTPAPTVQWQLSANQGASFTNIAGATSPSLTLVTSAAQSGYEYRAVFTNTCGTVTTSAATLTVYDICLKDASTDNILQFNSKTGDYRFIICGSEYTVTGRGKVSTVDSVVTVIGTQSTCKVQGSFNLSQLTGTATITLTPSPGVSQTIRIVDNTSKGKGCGC